MIKIPSGEITLRDDRIKTTWQVEIQAFQLCEFPVTQDLYFALTKKSPSAFIGDRKPVENVSWNKANETVADWF